MLLMTRWRGFHGPNLHPPVLIATGRATVLDAEDIHGAPPGNGDETMAVPGLVAWSACDWLLVFGMSLIIWVAFLPALANGWVAWDDDQNFHHNYAFRSPGLRGLGWAWTTCLLGVYQPAGWMLFEAEYAIGGLSPLVYHVASLGLHIVNASLLYLLIRVLLARFSASDRIVNRWEIRISSAIAVALFALHPLRVEVVAWVSCQPYLLCALFSMATVLAYLQACLPRGPARRLWLGLSLTASTAAMLSKAPAVVLPAVLAILDIYPLRRLGRPGSWLSIDARQVWREKLPFWAIALLLGMIAIRARLDVANLAPGSIVSFGWRPILADYAVGFYLTKTLHPFGLSAIYMPPTNRATLLLGSIILPGMMLLALRLRRSRPGLVAAWATYLAALLPGLGVVLLGHPVVADRSTYLASIAWAPVLARGMLRSRRGGGTGIISALGLLGVAAIVAAIPMTRRQCRTWRSTETLWAQAVSSGGKESVVAHRELAGAQLAHGRIGEAIRSYERAYELAARGVRDHRRESLTGAVSDDLGNALEEAGQSVRALEAYRLAIGHQSAALVVAPTSIHYRSFLVKHYINLGRLQAWMGDEDAALRSQRRARDVRAGLARGHPAKGSPRTFRPFRDENGVSRPGPLR